MISREHETEHSMDKIREQLAGLEEISRRLEPDSAVRHDITQQAADYIDHYIEGLSTSPAYVQGEFPQLKSLSVSEHGKPFEQLLKILHDEVDHIGISSASGKHLGYIPSGGIWSSAVADMLAAAANRYTGIYYSSPGSVIMENQIIKWLCSLVGYPSGSHGNLTSGGSIANLIAIKTARDFYKINSDNIKKSVIYFTKHVHHCIHKALNITALHEAVHRIIPMDEDFRMDTTALQNTLEADKRAGLNPFLVIATAGTTDTGAIDPLDKIADLCSEYNTWFHIDCAYGGFFILVDEIKEKFKGIERSDSLVMDPHKSMFIPYGSGIVLVKNTEALLKSFSHTASYMQDSYDLDVDEINPTDCSPELTKHARGLRIWLPLHLHGLEPFRVNLQEKLLLTKYFHEAIKQIGFETGPDPQLSITLFRFPTENVNEFNQKLVDSLHDDGRYFFSSTEINGELWIRCAVLSFRTHLNEIKQALEMIRENLERI